MRHASLFSLLALAISACAPEPTQGEVYEDKLSRERFVVVDVAPCGPTYYRMQDEYIDGSPLGRSSGPKSISDRVRELRESRSAAPQVLYEGDDPIANADDLSDCVLYEDPSATFRSVHMTPAARFADRFSRID